MKRLYEKSRLYFALAWIGVYVVACSLADGLSETVGVQKLFTAPLCLLMTGGLLWWLRKEGLLQEYGLTSKKLNPKTYLYFLPLVILASVNLWGGVELRLSLPETVLYVIAMLCVGFLEELIFRGFLFRAMCKDSLKWAVIVSSITFGLGHMINLLNGAAFIPTLLQIVYATAAGFLFTALYHRSGSLVPCIVTHSAINGLSAFSKDFGPVMEAVTACVLTAVSLLYAIWIWKKGKAR